jgi:hypothetical protein
MSWWRKLFSKGETGSAAKKKGTEPAKDGGVTGGGPVTPVVAQSKIGNESAMANSDMRPRCDACEAPVSLTDYCHISIMAESALLPSGVAGNEWYLLAKDHSGGDVRVHKSVPPIDAMFRGLQALTTVMAGEDAFREFKERAGGYHLAAKLFFCDKCTKKLGGTRAQAGARFLEKMAF